MFRHNLKGCNPDNFYQGEREGRVGGGWEAQRAKGLMHVETGVLG